MGTNSNPPHNRGGAGPMNRPGSIQKSCRPFNTIQYKPDRAGVPVRSFREEVARQKKSFESRTPNSTIAFQNSPLRSGSRCKT